MSISKLTTTFEGKHPEGPADDHCVTPAELDGLPQDFVDSHKPGADGKITLKTDTPITCRS